MFPEVLVVPVYFPVVAYLLWREVGPSCLFALAIVILQPPVQYVSLRLYAKWRCVDNSNVDFVIKYEIALKLQ